MVQFLYERYCLFVIFIKALLQVIYCYYFIEKLLMDFPVWLQNQLLSAGLESVLSQTEKSCIASNYRICLQILK